MIPFKNLLHGLFDAASRANNSFAGKTKNSNLKHSGMEGKGESGFLETFFDKASDENGSEKSQLNSHGVKSPVYTPKTVILEYPSHVEDEDGNATAHSEPIEVPLIAVTKLRATKIDNLKISTNLEVMLHEEELLADFASDGKATKNKGASVVHIELNITPDTSSEGMESMISGYSKALLSRIPH